MMFYMLFEGEVLAEIEASTSFAATADRAAWSAPLGAELVDLRSGEVAARRAEVRPGVIGWEFCGAGDTRRSATG